MNEQVKWCAGCETRQPFEAFAKHRAVADGRQSYCKACMNRYGATWRAAHPAYWRRQATERKGATA